MTSLERLLTTFADIGLREKDDFYVENLSDGVSTLVRMKLCGGWGGTTVFEFGTDDGRLISQCGIPVTQEQENREQRTNEHSTD